MVTEWQMERAFDIFCIRPKDYKVQEISKYAVQRYRSEVCSLTLPTAALEQLYVVPEGRKPTWRGHITTCPEDMSRSLMQQRGIRALAYT